MLYNVHDNFIGRALDLYGEYCEVECEMFRRFVRPGAVAVDVGANLGAHTVFFARQVTPSGTVAAFEPQRILFQTLCANLALNDLGNVFAFQQAVGAKRDFLVVPPLDYTRETNFGSVALRNYRSGEPVAVVRLDDLNLPACDFLKVDVEGMEREVLEGAMALIGRFKPVMYVENDLPHKREALARFVDALGYKMYWHQPPYFNPANFFGNRDNVFGGLVATNMVCIHRDVPRELADLVPIVLPSG
jgi:FkbM family methyltransferase